MMGKVMAFRPVEQVRQDSEPIALLYRSMGTRAAAEVVSRALAELALTLAGLEERLRTSRDQDLARQLRRLQRMAEQLGMVSLGQVASDAQKSLAAGDMIAFSAIGARLMRVAEATLAADTAVLDRRP